MHIHTNILKRNTQSQEIFKGNMQVQAILGRRDSENRGNQKIYIFKMENGRHLLSTPRHEPITSNQHSLVQRFRGPQLQR